MSTAHDTSDEELPPAAIGEFLNVCLGSTEGYLIVAAGRDPHLDNGKYRHHTWGPERSYRWPAEADTAERDILRVASEADVYVCPYVMSGKQRAKWAAATRMLVHADVDTDLDIEKVRTLCGFAVTSGTPGHAHVYVALAEPVTGPQHQALCRGLGKFLGAKDSKCSDNDVLRPPGTFNHKPTVTGGQPVMLGWAERPMNRVLRTPKDLARQLRVELPSAEVNGKSSATDIFTNSEPVDLTAHPGVHRAVDKVTDDRSEDIYRILGACFDAGFTFDGACEVVRSRADLVDKLNEVGGDDLNRSWVKLVDKRQNHAQASASDNETNGQEARFDDPTVWSFTDGASFILDIPATIPTLWGQGNEILWAEGESLMIAGPMGLGKTTLLGLLIRAQLGVGDPTVLKLPVTARGGRILYLAMDRPAQIARALRRQFTEDQRDVLNQRLVIWKGPPPSDVAKNPTVLTRLAEAAGADTVYLDSIKDAAIGLSDDEVGAGYNRARQHLITNGCQLAEAHHTVKRGSGGGPPTAVADIYGSAWITNGTGSIVLLSGEPGDPIVGFRHIRQPADEVGPYRLLHDQSVGSLTIDHAVDLVEMVRLCGVDGLTAKGAAAAVSERDNPSRANIEKARRKLDQLVAEEMLVRVDGDRGRGGSTTAWFLAERRRE